VTVSYAADDEAGAAVKAAAASDVAIVVVGNHPTCGPNMAKEWTKGGDTTPCADPGEGREGRDRETLALSQEELVRKVHAANPRTVMVLVSSFPYTINWSQEHVPAILHMAHSSQDEGWALAQVLFGDENPGGHTVVTWPAAMDQLPPMMDYDIRNGRTYMYAKGTPLYPFGHGLSYTTFEFARLRTDEPALAADGQLEVSVDVTNSGKVAGDAVPQLYVKHLGSKVERPALQRVLGHRPQGVRGGAGTRPAADRRLVGGRPAARGDRGAVAGSDQRPAPVPLARAVSTFSNATRKPSTSSISIVREGSRRSTASPGRLPTT
jgi:beta-glucosidase